jgi:hypothetical protein
MINLELNLTKDVKDLYTENKEILLRKFKDIHKWRDIPCSKIRRLYNIKMSLIPKLFSAIHIKIPVGFCRS